MKNKAAWLFCVFSFILLRPQAYSQADSLSIKPLMASDSVATSYEWTSKGSLSEKLEQQREDNRAEVESMKRRFRAFHEQSSSSNSSEKTNEDQDFLWSEAEESRNDESFEEKAPVVAPNDTEETRMLINRSFQQEAYPSTPSSYQVDDLENNENVRPKGGQMISSESNWEEDAFQSNASNKVDWQLNLGQNPTNLPTVQPFKKGQVINMDLSFDEKSSVLNPAVKRQLDEWVVLLSQHKGIKVEIASHTHKGIPYTEALALSTQRARAIVDYLMISGIAPSQLNFKGYGYLSPLFPATDINNQQKNERIELIILELPKR